MEDQIIDYETGEIIEIEHKTAEDILPRLARTTRALDLEIERLNKYKETEVSRIVESVDFKVKGLEDRRTRILEMSRQLLEQENTNFRDYPGIGKFQVRKSPDSIDISVYESLPDSLKQQTMAKYPSLFKTTTTVRVDKKEVMGLIKENLDPVPDGFFLVKGDKKIYFNKE